jgi:hypothetical protein
MRRYIVSPPYAGDPTEGPTMPNLVAPLDKVELVQPDSGDLYPPAPAATVYASIGCNDADVMAADLALVVLGADKVADVEMFNNLTQMGGEDYIRAYCEPLLAEMDAAFAAMGLEAVVIEDA